jgi:hypothetical protein
VARARVRVHPRRERRQEPIILAVALNDDRIFEQHGRAREAPRESSVIGWRHVEESQIFLPLQRAVERVVERPSEPKNAMTRLPSVATVVFACVAFVWRRALGLPRCAVWLHKILPLCLSRQ